MLHVCPHLKGSLRATRVAIALIFSALVSVQSVSAQAPPAPWVARDIGSPAIAGSTTYSSGTYTVSAGGVDIWNTSDQFHFVYQQITGDVDVMVRVQSIGNSHSWAKTGVMIRESLTGSSRHAFALLSAANGYGYQDRIDPGGFSNSVSGVTGVAPGWVRLVRTGSQIEAFRSTNGTSWISMGVDVVPMVATVYVGIATTSHKATVATKAVLTNLKVTAATAPVPPSNQPPTISLTAPANGATYSAPASISMAASAADADGTVSKVEFYSGTTLLGTDTTAPYSYTWSSVPAGTYSLSAVPTIPPAPRKLASEQCDCGNVLVDRNSAPWTATDIGAPALSGSATYSNGTFSLSGAGVDIWDTADQFRFVYQAISGDVELSPGSTR